MALLTCGEWHATMEKAKWYPQSSSYKCGKGGTNAPVTDPEDAEVGLEDSGQQAWQPGLLPTELFH